MIDSNKLENSELKKITGGFDASMIVDELFQYIQNAETIIQNVIPSASYKDKVNYESILSDLSSIKDFINVQNYITAKQICDLMIGLFNDLENKPSDLRDVVDGISFCLSNIS